MSTSVCAHPIAFEEFVAYWSGDLPNEDEGALELHVMGCAQCTASSERVSAVVLGVRSSIPHLLTNRLVAKLQARGARIEENPMMPGERKPVLFRRAVDVLVHRLGGLDLANASQVSVVIRDEDTGNVLYEETPAAFDAVTGEVLVACQPHFAAFPHNVIIEVRATGPAAEPMLARYMIPHTFEGPGPT